MSRRGPRWPVDVAAMRTRYAETRVELYARLATEESGPRWIVRLADMLDELDEARALESLALRSVFREPAFRAAAHAQLTRSA